MCRSEYSEEQVIGILMERDVGRSTVEICRKYGVSNAIFYKWHGKYGGMEVSDARKLKALEDEKRKVKTLLAESMLDVSILTDRYSGKRCEIPGDGVESDGPAFRCYMRTAV